MKESLESRGEEAGVPMREVVVSVKKEEVGDELSNSDCP